MLWGELKYIIGRKVNDAEATREESLIHNANAALRMFASMHTAISSTFEVAGDGETSAFPLPDNAIEEIIQGVYDDRTNTWLRKVEFFPGEVLGSGYYIWPHGVVNVNPAPRSDITIYYLSYYPEIEDDDSQIIVPGWAIEAIALYAAGRTLEDEASRMSIQGSYRTRVDAGNPEHQPVLRLSEHYIKQSEDILRAHHSPQRDYL